MLPAAARMRRRVDFSRAVRSGRRASRELISAHLLSRAGNGEPARIGFVVRRGLRHLARGYLGSLPEGSLLVVRANPRAATARQADLAAELDLVIGALLRRQGGTQRP